ncbi:MAG: hypothetical protein ACM30E_08735 [Nitrososphaerales archaeon]
MYGIEWMGVARNALWIVGLAVAFAAASHASWRASERGGGLRREWGKSAFLIPISAGLHLVTASLAWGAALVWERVLWTAASIAFLWCIFELLRRQRAKQQQTAP